MINGRTGATSSRFLVAGVIIAALIVAVVSLLNYDSTGKSGSGLSSPFVYDIGKMAQIDPNLIMYKLSEKPFATGFAKSSGIALDSDGSVYVVGDKAVRKFNTSGVMISEIQLTGEPYSVFVSEDKRVYAGLRDHVEVYDNTGERIAAWENLGENALLTSITVEQDDVFVADAGNRIVYHYDIDGNRKGRIGEKDEQRGIPGFVIPSPYFDLAIAPDGLLRVINPGNHRIEAYTYKGDMEFEWGKFSGTIEGFCGCCNPVNFAILPDESFVTVEKGLIRVKLYDSNGQFVGVVAGPEELGVEGPVKINLYPEKHRSGGFDVAVDAKGRIFVLNTIKNVVRIFSRKGAK